MLRTNDRPTHEVISVGSFELVPSQRVLTRNGKAVKLGSRSFDILLTLADRAGDVVSQKELIAKVWPDVFVEDVSLRVHIAALRKALDCDGTRYLMNVPGRGYSLVAPISRGIAEESTEPDQPVGPLYALPAALLHMVGREQDVGEICEKLLSRKFVTIFGSGGVGKTTVALSVAHALLKEFRGAVCFVELSPVGSPHLLAAAVTSAFRLPVQAEDPIPALVAHLRGKRVLLVLDSCEHLIAKATIVAERLIGEVSDLHILATSREVLRAEGEHAHPLPPLASPPENEKLTAAETLAFPAAQLFVRRIVAAGASDRLSDEDARIVGEMCRQLGGIALAIELAAGRVAAYGIRDTAALLSSQFALLWPGRRTAPLRQQTLNATLDWSYNLLSDDERKVFRQLAAFTGGFTLDAAHRVVGDAQPGNEEILSIIASLLAKSLVSTDLSATVRHRLQDMTRTYAASKLQQTDESRDLQRRHANYYRDLLLQAALDNQDPRTFAVEIDNIRAALHWSFGATGNDELGVQLAALSATTWLGLGLLTECHYWMKTASNILGDTSEPQPQQLGIYMALASTLLFTASEIDEFEPTWNKALGVAVSLGDVASQMSCHLALWARQVRVPRYAASLAVAEECLITATRSENPGAIGQAEWMLGESKLFLGRLEEGLGHFRRFIKVDTEPSRLAMQKQTGYDRLSDGLGYGSCLLWLMGLPEQALHIGREALSAGVSSGIPLPLAVATMWCGLNRYFLEPDIDKIEAEMVEIIEHATAHGLPQFHGFGLSILGLCQARRGQFEEARRLVEEGLRLQAATHNKVFHPVIRTELAEAAAGLGRITDAKWILRQNEDDDVNDPEHWCTPEVLRVRGVIAEATGDADPAAVLYRRAAALAHRQGALFWELRAAVSLSKMRARHPGEALKLLEPVYGRFTEGFDTAGLLAAKRLIDELKMMPDIRSS